MNQAVGNALIQLRFEQGWSQEKLAEKINSHQVYISEIENGKKLPSLNILIEMAKAYNTTLTDIASRIEYELDHLPDDIDGIEFFDE